MYCLSEIRTRAIAERVVRVRSSRAAEMRPLMPWGAGRPVPACEPARPAGLLEALPDALVVLDDAQRVRYASPAIEGILRERPADLVGRPLGLTIVEDETAEVGLVRPDGSRCVVEMRVAPVRWEGRAARLVSLRDVTTRSELEEAARRGVAREAGRRAVAGVARDYRDLLTTLLCGAQLLEEAARGGEEVGELAQRVLGAAREASQLTRRLLSAAGARVQEGQGADLDATLAAFAARWRPLLAEGLVFDVDPGAPGARVPIDSALLDHLLGTLVQNACDALPAEGTLRIATSRREVPPGGSAVPGAYAVLAVVDTGSGMSPETRARLFEAYFSTKERRRGRGLGLAEVYGLVAQAGGRIEVESELGEGTRVEVLLPLAGPETGAETPAGDEPASAEGAAQPAVPAGPAPADELVIPYAALTGRTVLLAEDEEGIRRLLGEVLEQAGAAVVHAADVVEAERILRDPARTVDLVITDMRMPGGNGLDVVRTARVQAEALPAIVISGFSTHMPLGALPSGPTEFLPKPFLPGALLELACRLLPRPNAGPGRAS